MCSCTGEFNWTPLQLLQCCWTGRIDVAAPPGLPQLLALELGGGVLLLGGMLTQCPGLGHASKDCSWRVPWPGLYSSALPANRSPCEGAPSSSASRNDRNPHLVGEAVLLLQIVPSMCTAVLAAAWQPQQALPGG